MSEQAEIIDSSRKSVLSCFPVEYKNDEEITTPENAEKSEVCICSLDENFIISYRSRRSDRLISDVAFEKQNAAAVVAGIERLLNDDRAYENPVEFENGKDKILITFSSSWAHTLPAPLERINLYNRRNYEMDDLRSQDLWLSLPPHAAAQFDEELKKSL